MLSALTANEVEVHYCEIRSIYGHDAFLLESGQINYLVGKFLSHTVVGDVMVKKVQTIEEGTTIAVAATEDDPAGVNHLPVLSAAGQLVGIVTSWDIAKAVASNFLWLDEIMSRNVITTTRTSRSRGGKKDGDHAISALPVVDDEQHVIGLITSRGDQHPCREGRTREDPLDPCRPDVVPCHEKNKGSREITEQEDSMEECVVLFLLRGETRREKPCPCCCERPGERACAA